MPNKNNPKHSDWVWKSITQPPTAMRKPAPAIDAWFPQTCSISKTRSPKVVFINPNRKCPKPLCTYLHMPAAAPATVTCVHVSLTLSSRSSTDYLVLSTYHRISYVLSTFWTWVLEDVSDHVLQFLQAILPHLAYWATEVVVAFWKGLSRPVEVSRSHDAAISANRSQPPPVRHYSRQIRI